MNSETDFKTVPFKIKLKYKVGTSIQLLTIEEFSYKVIKNAEMIEKEREKYIKVKEKEYDTSLNLYYQTNKDTGKDYSTLKNEFDKIKDNKELTYKRWARDDEHFKDFKTYINEVSSNNVPFNIVNCPYYYEYESLLEYTQNNNVKSDKIRDPNSISDTLKELEIIKDNNKLTKDVLEFWIQGELVALSQDKNATAEDVQKYNLFYLVFNKDENEDSELKISKKKEFEELGIGLYEKPNKETPEGLEQKIKRNKLAYLLFETNMRAKLENQGILEINFNDKIRGPLIFGSDDNKYIETDKIYNFNSIEKIYNVLFNIQYLEKNQYIKVKAASGSKYLLFSDIFRLDRLKKHALAVCNILFTQFKNQIELYKNIRNKYKDNINEFFIQNKQLSDKTGVSDSHIIDYFSFLKKNFEENVLLDALPSTVRFQKSDIKPLNTEKKRKSIVTNYAKYILDPDELEEKNEDQLYSRLKADRTKLSNVITYHNLHKILETLYLSKGTILKVPLFEMVDNKLQEPKANDENYIKILQINPIKLDIDERRRAFDGNKIEAIFEMQFEKLYTYSTIKFHLNIIDINNPDNLLQKYLENEENKFQSEKKIELETKKNLLRDIETTATQQEIDNLKNEIKNETEKEKELSIIELNNTYSIYRRYSNKIFTNIKNPDNKIIIEAKFDYDKLMNNFNILKNTVERRYPDEKIDNLRDIFVDSKIFDFIFKETQFKHNPELEGVERDIYIKKIIIKYYLNNFFFKINSNLSIDNKIAQIIDVQIRRTDSVRIKVQKNMKDHNSDIKEKLFYKEPSKKTRLALDDVDNIYNVFLDVSVFLKNKITDKVPLSLRIKTVSGCIQRANTLDKIMYSYLKDLYPKNLLENKVRNKEGSNLENNAQIQKGGKNKVTKKNINKRRHNTLKNLVTYYAI